MTVELLEVAVAVIQAFWSKALFILIPGFTLSWLCIGDFIIIIILGDFRLKWQYFNRFGLILIASLKGLIGDFIGDFIIIIILGDFRLKFVYLN